MSAKKLILFCLLAILSNACASEISRAQTTGNIFPLLSPPAGIAVNAQGRFFTGFSRHSGDRSAAAPVAFAAPRIRSRGKADSASWLISAQGIWVDEKATLWLTDDGKIHGAAAIADGAVKIITIAPLTTPMLRTLSPTGPESRRDSHYHGLRTDLTLGTAATLGWSDALTWSNHALYASPVQWQRAAVLPHAPLIMRASTADSAEHQCPRLPLCSPIHA